VGVSVGRCHVERDAVDGGIDTKTESIREDMLAAFRR